MVSFMFFRIIFIFSFIFINLFSIEKDEVKHKIKAVVFDCDGTLIDNGISYYLMSQYAMKKQGYDLSQEEFWAFMNEHKLVGNPDIVDKVLNFFCDLLGRECKKELLGDLDVISRKIAEENFPVVEPTVAFLKELRVSHTHLKFAVASAGPKEHVLKNLRRHNLEDHFDVIISGMADLKHIKDPTGVNKPKPYIYLHVAEKLGVLPQECLVIEDSSTGVEAAKKAGCVVIAIPSIATKAHDLSLADTKLESLSDISFENLLKMTENK
ncbi:MAG: Phosphoglycolate phosphatase [Chlamydiia bacterium]|nr:Phosphoglycolate phosphatase [Chlamydiia bacterium]